MTFTCTLCGKTKVARIPVADHHLSYREEADGHTVFCSLCTYAYTEDHDYRSGECICGGKELRVDETIRIGHTLNLTADIAINFAVAEAQLAHYDSYYMECVVPMYEGNILTGTKTVTLEPEKRNGYYYFVLDGLISLEINNIVQARLHLTKGEEKICFPSGSLQCCHLCL